MTKLFPDKYHLEISVIKTEYCDDGTIADITTVDTGKTHQEDQLVDASWVLRQFLKKCQSPLSSFF